MAWGRLGMPAGMMDLLRRKYDILQSGADSQRIGITADANLANVRAGLLPNAERAANEKTAAEIATLREQEKFIGPLARSEIALRGDQGYNYRTAGRLNLANVGNVNAQTTGLNQDNRITNFGIRSLNENDGIRQMLQRAVRLGLGPFGN
jgi:hypothetical protein